MPGSQIGFTGAYDQEEVFHERTVLAVDCSSSMSLAMGSTTRVASATGAATGFAKRKYDMFSEDPRYNGEIAVVAFNSEVIGHVPLTPYKKVLKTVVPFLKQLQAEGGTDFERPLLMAEKLLRPKRTPDPEILDRVIFLTDGESAYPQDVCTRLKEHWVLIDVIGIGQSAAEVDQKVLEQMASVLDGKTRYRFVKNADALTQHFFTLAGALHE